MGAALQEGRDGLVGPLAASAPGDPRVEVPRGDTVREPVQVRTEGGAVLEVEGDDGAVVPSVVDEEGAGREVLGVRCHVPDGHHDAPGRQPAESRDDPADARPRLATDMLVAAFRHALTGWAAGAEDTADPAGQEPAARLRENVAALPGSLTLTTARR